MLTAKTPFQCNNQTVQARHIKLKNFWGYVVAIDPTDSFSLVAVWELYHREWELLQLVRAKQADRLCEERIVSYSSYNPDRFLIVLPTQVKPIQIWGKCPKVEDMRQLFKSTSSDYKQRVFNFESVQNPYSSISHKYYKDS